MNKFCGKIGYALTVERADGVWEEDYIEREYYGDVLRNNARWTNNQYSTNSDFNINNEISVIADPFAFDNINAMKYVEYLRTLWKIESVEIRYPRINIYIGGVFTK